MHMNKASKFLALATLLGAGVLAAQPASATVCMVSPCIQQMIVGNTPPFGTTLSLATPGDDLATVTAVSLMTGFTYDFTFTTDATYEVLTQLQASISGGRNKPAKSLEIGYELYSGAPGSGSLISTSGFGLGPSLDNILKGGNYYLQVNPDQISRNMELTSGSAQVFSATPEPATWVSMIFGFGMLGGLMRFTRRASSLSAAA
jgi:hypothetical protein